MKLANKVYSATLLILMLAFAAIAQSNARPESDPRNTAPTVGTGGPIGGPTGLFTIYDGETLRKGEYTFSIAYSNYDRDPGNVDFTVAPFSFQIGLWDKFEAFFGAELWRGVKVNNPRHLSSFYLPNSTLFINGSFQSPPAIVLSPQGPGVSQFPNQAIFRPMGAPYSAFPYVGGSIGTLGFQPPYYSGPVFGFAPLTNAQLGPPTSGSSNGADMFPGIGSVYGSILPGIVLTTVSLPVATGAAGATGPGVFTTAPTYVADAPFINQRYDTTTLNSLDFGFKWRWTGLNNPIGAGVAASYRWYLDSADSPGGFGQLQRGAGPGGNRGDLNVTLFASARLAKWANLSGNLGFTYTSPVKSKAFGSSYTILDRRDELHVGIGADFPVNKYFQPIAEILATRYVGGGTPNAFEHHPIDGLIGARIFIRRWVGISLAYRYNFNQQDLDSFDESNSFSGAVTIPCPIVTMQNGIGGSTCQVVTINNSFQGAPPGFVPSIDPHGFMAQFFIGRRDERAREIENKPAMVNSVSLSDSVITLGCAPGYKSQSGNCEDSRTINVTTNASDPENDVLTYNYTVSGGRIVGTGSNVQWDLSGVQEGTYTVTVGVDDGCGVCGQTKTETVKVEACPDCVKVCDCPTLSVSGPGGITDPGETMTFTANVSNPSGLTYNWSVSSGTIVSGQGTRSITVATTSEMANSNVTATVQLGGLDANCNCPDNASETAGIAPKPEATLVDEFGKMTDDDVKARIDNFYIQLNNNPNSQGYIINYGTAAQIKKRRAQIMKAINFRKYDVNRVTFVDGGDRGNGEETKMWLVPPGAEAPAN